MTQYQCRECGRNYDLSTAMRRNYQCCNRPLQPVGTQISADIQFTCRQPANGNASTRRQDDVQAMVVIPPSNNDKDALAVEGLLASLTTSTYALEISGDERGRRFIIRGRPPTLRYLRAQLKSVYGQVDFETLTQTDDPAYAVSDERVTARLDLGNLPALSLRTFRDGDFEQADPVAGILGAFSDFAKGEYALARLVLRPAPKGWERPYMHLAMAPNERLKVEAPMDGGGMAAMMGLLGADVILLLGLLGSVVHHHWLWTALLSMLLLSTGAGWAALVRRARANTVILPDMVTKKMSTPAYEFQLRLIAGAPTDAQARARVLQMAAAFRQFNAGMGNRLELTFTDEPAGIPLKQQHKPKPAELTGGWRRSFTGKASNILSVAEVASLWHFPTGSDVAMLRQVTSRRYSPLPEEFEAIEQGVLIGHMENGEDGVPVFLEPAALRKHTLLVGKTQKGKSTLMQHLALAHIDAGSGLVYLDPHGKAVKELLGLIPPERIDDVLYLDFTADDRLIGWNMLAGGSGISHKKIVEAFLQMGETVWEDNWGPRMESALRFAILALTEANETLIFEKPDLQFTVADINAVLTMREFQSLLLGLYVEDWETLRWFEGYYRGLTEQKKEDVINPVQTKIHRLIGSDTVVHILGQSQSTFSFDEIVRGNKIVLVNLDAGAITSRNTALLGTMFLTYLQLAIRRQSSRSSSSNAARVAVIVDEFQQIPFSYSELLGELQKMGASFTIGTQSLAQLDAVDPHLRGALLGNVDTLVSFQVSALDARPLVAEFDENNLTISDFTGLKEHRCYVRTTRGGKPTSPLLIKTRPLPAQDTAIRAKIRDRLSRYTHTMADVQTMLRTHQKYWYRREYEKYRKSEEERKRLRELMEKSGQLLGTEGTENIIPDADGRVDVASSFDAGGGNADDIIPFDTTAEPPEKKTKRKRTRTRRKNSDA